jgi:hypothetical protein
MMGRRYFRHRRAWSPRAWPTVVPFVFGVGGALLRWAVWRWRHPVITRDQYIEDLRRAARWN